MMKYPTTAPVVGLVMAAVVLRREKECSPSTLHHKNLGIAWRMDYTDYLSSTAAMLAALKSI